MLAASFLLDTNICIYALDGHDQVLGRFAEAQVGSLAISTITYGELRAGAERNPETRSTDLAVLERLVRAIVVLPFDIAAAEAFGRVRVQSTRRRASFDHLIAAHAIALGITLVTNNVQDFETIPSLRVENWAAA